MLLNGKRAIASQRWPGANVGGVDGLPEIVGRVSLLNDGVIDDGVTIEPWHGAHDLRLVPRATEALIAGGNLDCITGFEVHRRLAMGNRLKIFSALRKLGLVFGMSA